MSDIPRSRYYLFVERRNKTNELLEDIENNIDESKFIHLDWFAEQQKEILNNKKKIIAHLRIHNITLDYCGRCMSMSSIVIQHNNCIDEIIKFYYHTGIRNITADQLETLIDLHIVLNESLNSLIELVGHDHDSTYYNGISDQ
jgi:hypothetical protein